MSLPVDEMVRLARNILDHTVANSLVGDLACHILALAEELGQVRAAPRPRTIVHSAGGRWDLFEDDWMASRFVAAERAKGCAVEAWNVSEWTWHARQEAPGVAQDAPKSGGR